MCVYAIMCICILSIYVCTSFSCTCIYTYILVHVFWYALVLQSGITILVQVLSVAFSCSSLLACVLNGESVCHALISLKAPADMHDMLVCTCVCKYIYTYCIYICIYIYTYIHVYIYILLYLRLFVFNMLEMCMYCTNLYEPYRYGSCAPSFFYVLDFQTSAKQLCTE